MVPSALERCLANFATELFLDYWFVDRPDLWMKDFRFEAECWDFGLRRRDSFSGCEMSLLWRFPCDF